MGDVDYNVTNGFVAGMITAGFLVAGLFFARFWSRSGDFLFLAFTAAFWLLALNQALVALVPVPTEEQRSWSYILRVAAFVLIAVAIVRKNTARR
jgi:hypothetical protein